MLDRNLVGFLFAKSKFRAYSFWRLVFVFICVFVIELCWSDCGACYRGICVDGTCVCEDGWTGTECDHCGGRTRLDLPVGTIYDSEGSYNTDTSCVWLIDSGKPGTSISLYLEAFATECSWDYLYIFDGDSIYAPQVAAFSGPVRYSDIHILHEVTTTSGYAFLYFYSDAAFKFEGFNITYRVDSCPLGCSGHGVCNPTFKNCTCDPLWTGEGCDMQACPANCSGNGDCSMSQRRCVCEPGYEGLDCSTCTGKGYWQIEEGKAYGRASAAVVQQDNLVWIIGGYEFDKSNISIIRYDLDDELSQEIHQLGEVPGARYGHSAVLYQDEIYVFGGSLLGREVTDELHIFNLTSSTWVCNVTYEGKPTAVEGHTAVVYEDTMVVFFGYSPKYSYISTVQEYNFTNKTWRAAETTGAQVVGMYGHSNALDPVRNVVYIHAGYVTSSRDTDLTDCLYQYDLAKKEWRVLPSSNQPRFLHSAVILNDVMFVYGGNTHTDSVEYNGAKCFSNDFLAYDISCQSWSTVPINTLLPQDIARYGHAAFVYDGKMYIYSGFTGVMQENIIVYNPGNCSARANATHCLEVTPGLSCQWDMAGNQCISSNAANQSGLVPGNSSLQQCPLEPPEPQCSQSYCSKCQMTPGCGWCDSKCRKLSECSNQDDIFCPGTLCSLFLNCRACNAQDGCRWQGNKCENHTGGTKSACPIACDAHDSCQVCVEEPGCMWCTNQRRCIDSNSYITTFPYGLCWEWHTNLLNCPVTNCSQLKTCDACQANPHCGWCDSGEMNGLGTCMEGSLAGPVKVDKAGDAILELGLCPVESWYYFDCPSCQCNGHSRCVNDTTSICVNCQNNTTGPQCENCADGYFGDALNGGSCSPCQCNNHGTKCDSSKGQCFCNTKGVVGFSCDRCDIEQNYYGNPLNRGTCYYKLSMNYEYTFNLSSNDELHLTMINLMTSPELSNRDIEFLLQVSKEINLNITYRSNQIPGIEREVVYRVNTNYFSTTFSTADYNYETEVNTTFFVYISNFTVPLSFKVSFTTVREDVNLILFILVSFIITLVIFLTVMGLIWRFHQLYMIRVMMQVSVRQRFILLNLLEFLVVFFSCFLSFLLFFVIGWKVKQRCDSYHRQQITFYQRSFDLLTVLVAFFVCFFVIIILFGTFLKLKDYWDRYRHRRNRAVELAVMARRPFSSVNLVIENTAPPDIVAGTNKKHPLAFAMEMCSDNKAQVATIFMQMPMPDGDKVPFGQTRFSLASALVLAKAKKERRNSQQKQEPRDAERSEVNLNNACVSPVPRQGTRDATNPDRRELVEERSRPELHVIQNHFPASYDNAAMV